MSERDEPAPGIAVIGLAGRFPGAEDIERFWENLAAGRETITFFGADELRTAGVDPRMLDDPSYVRARGLIAGAELFDAAFFGLSPREAEIMDPQHRLLLECSWQALEHAGYDARRYDGPIGVFAGAGSNTYLLFNLASNRELVDAVGLYQAMLGSDGDFLATRISYKLDLKGPSLTVQTACSTSLVAVHLAAQSLLNGECDMALAGGVRIAVPQRAGYLYQPGGIFSPDGHCRPFDAAAQGCLDGDGVALVVLKRLADALADGDHVHAVIRGSAINNDGAAKVGYTAPSVRGQAEVIAMALAVAEVAPGTIGYVEAHGTATPLGDPIEVAALAEVFGGGAKTSALGSVKGNVGHLDAAAGVAGLIKTILALERRQLPPSLHFERPNPQIDFDRTPFVVNTELRDWPAGATPRRAGVSSFGIGGTNAHVVLEEAPAPAPGGPSRPAQLLLLSAATAPALEAATSNLVAHLRRHPDTSLPDLAATLQLGRRAFPHRRMVVCDSVADGMAALDALDPKQVLSRVAESESRAVAFLFPGQGAQHAGMAAALYRTEPVFRREVDGCLGLLPPALDLGEIFASAPGPDAEVRLAWTARAQPALFVVEYALARLWMEWGIRPEAMLGHSIGELVAACLAGVFTLEEALHLVAVRGRLMQEAAPGAMLSVALAEDAVRPLLTAGLEVAAVNTPSLCVVAGPAEAIVDLAGRLAARGVQCRRLHTSHAFHSASMEPVRDRFREAVAGCRPRAPEIPFVSNRTGTWIRPDEATDPSYWAEHLRAAVRFSQGLEKLFVQPGLVLLEVGPGRSLAALARQHPGKSTAQLVLSSLPAVKEAGPEIATLLRTAGQLWLAGVAVDWRSFSAHEQRRRLALPTYPFERRRFWVEPGTMPAHRPPHQRLELADWFYAALWKQTVPLARTTARTEAWLVFLDEVGLGQRLATRLGEQGARVVTVRAGDRCAMAGEGAFEIRPGVPEDYAALFDRLGETGFSPSRIAHLWSVTAPAQSESAAEELELGFYSLLFLAQALAGRRGGAPPEPLHLGVLSTGLQQVTGDETLQPAKAALLGPVTTIPQELPGVTCQSLDLVLPKPGSRREEELIELLLAELEEASADPIVAWRGGGRWLRTFEPVRLAAPAADALPLRRQGAYLVTGGLGGVGLELAELLARTVQARIVLTGRSPFPARETWPQRAVAGDHTAAVIRRLLALEELGAEVLVATADVTDPAAMAGVLALACERFGQLRGVIHAAGVAGGGLIQLKTRQAAARVLAPKVAGTLVLAELLAGQELDFIALCSSLNAVLGGAGQADYAAANAFLDAFAEARAGEQRFFAIAWDSWRGVGMAATPPLPAHGAGRQEAPVPERRPFDHPLLTQRAVVAGNGDAGSAAVREEIFFSYLQPAESWILAEHRLGGHAIVPGTAYLEMAGAAFRSLVGNGAEIPAIELSDVLFIAPLRVADDERREVRTILRRNGNGFHFNVRSNPGVDGWQEHVVGAIRETAVEPARFDLAELMAGCTEQILGEAYQEDLRMVGLGPRWESLKKVYVGEETVLGLLELAPELSDDVERFHLHPALLDIATSFGEMYAPRGEGYYLPLSYRRLRVHRTLPRRLWSYVRFKNAGRPSTETLAFDIAILDEDGVERVNVEEFTLKRVDVAGAIRGRQDAAQSTPGTAVAMPADGGGQAGEGMDAGEAVETFRRVLAGCRLPRVAVSPHFLPAVIERARAFTPEQLASHDRRGAAAGHDRPALDTPYVAPRDEPERRLAALWQEILGIARVGVFDNFFELGGHSLLGTQLVSRVRAELQVEVPLARLFEAATVADFAAVIEAERAIAGEAAAGPREPGRAPASEAPPLVSTPSAGTAPLSFAQQRLWFLDRLDPGSVAYNLPRGLRLNGALGRHERTALAASFTEIVRRHEILRTTFHDTAGGPVQAVASPLPLPLPLVDLAGLAGAVRQGESGRIVREAARRPFDLSRGPLIRTLLLRLAPAEHTLSVVMHHIVTDGWSMGLFVRETWALYPALGAGRPSPLPEPPIQYRDFALWQRSWLDGGALDGQLDYWTRRLADLPEELDLPLDRPRPAVEAFRGGIRTFALPAALAREVIALARRHAATSAMTLLAAFQTVLARYAGQDDFAVGMAIAGRNRREVEDLIGFFVNTLVVRADLVGDPGFGSLLERVRKAALEAYANQDLPFEKLVEELHPVRSLQRPPLFQVLFGFETLARQTLAMPGLTLAPLEEEAIDTGTAKFDLTLFAFEQEGALQGVLEYNAELFETATVQRLLGHFEALLAAAVADPARSWRELAILSPAERAQLAVEWNDTAAPAPPAMAVQAFFEARAERAPDAVAVEMDSAALTYGALEARSNRLARYLRGLGAGPEGLVGICLERSLDLAVAVLAALKAGSAYVPLDPAYPPERLARMIEDARPAALVTAASLLGRPALAGGGCPVVSLAREGAAPIRWSAARPAVALTGQELAYVLYTSGSTGRPKGVAMPHQPLVNLIGWQLAASPSPLRTLQFASLSFDVSFQEMFATWAAGATLVLVDEEVRRDPPALARLLAERRIERLFLPFVALQQLAEAALEVGLPDALCEVMTAGEQLRTSAPIVELFRRLPGCRLENQYGPTEAHVVTALALGAAPAGWPALPPIGRPLSNLRILLLERGAGLPGAPVPEGVHGELMIGGAGLARGYLGRPDLTAERFLPSPLGEPGSRLYRSGDLARWLPGGVIEYLGRTDHQVKVRGFRIEPGEVEAALAAHPGVRQAVVLARGDAGEAQLVAYVVAREGAAPVPAELSRHLEAVLPPAMVPSSFVLLPALPVTPNGKVDRRALPAPAALATLGEGPAAPPRTPIEELVCEIWADVLGLPRVGRHDSFFALGGHSLLATRAASRLRQTFGVEVPLRAFFEAPAPAALAGRIEALLRGAGTTHLAPPLVALPLGQARPLSFAQERLWFLHQLQPESAAYNLPAAVRLIGRIDRPALAAALAEIVRRHEVLRTVFAAGVEGPAPVVMPPPPAVGLAVDLSALGERRQEQETRRLIAQETGRPFDLAAGPLLRVVLLCPGGDELLLLLTQHHIVSDGWSIGVLVRELGALYGAGAAGRPSPLPELAFQYADYAAWQRAWLKGEVLAAQIASWRGRLAGAPELLELPADHPRPQVQSLRGGHAAVILPTDGLRQLVRRQGATLFMALLAGVAALLARLTGRTDLPLGSPIAGRGRPETEDLIGFFVNTLVLRADLSGDPGGGELLARVREMSLGAYEHQDLPFERLVEELAPVRSLAYSPLVQVLVALQNSPQGALELPGLELSPVELESAGAKFDLTLLLREVGPELTGSLEYARDLFDGTTAARWAGHLAILLTALAADPQRRISELPLLSAAERAQLFEWGTTAAPPPEERCLDEIFAEQAARTPEAIALVSGDAHLSYRELAARSERLAEDLRAHGVGPDLRVGLLLDRSAEAVIAMLAVLTAGGAYVPLDPAYPARRLRLLVADTGAVLVVSRPGLAAALSESAVPLLLLDRRRESARPAAAVPPRRPLPESLAYVMYTSGSQGRPKGVAVVHRGVVRLVRGAGYARFGPQEVWLQLAPLSFDAATLEIWGALLHGGRLVVAPPEVPTLAGLGDLLTERGVTSLWLTAGLFHQMVDENLAGLRGVRQLLAGGDVVSPVHARRAVSELTCTLVNGYGPTENTTFTCCHPMTTPEQVGTTVAIGRPIANTRVAVLDRALDPMPVGAAGELYTGGAGLARGYWGRPDLTAERFVPDPYGGPGERLYRTGDLARFRPTGEIDFLGRIDDQVKVRGFRIEPGEVAAALAAHPGVRQTVVLTRTDTGEPRLVAYAAAQDGVALSAAELSRHLEAVLPAYLMPSSIVLLPDLPLTPNGKVDRKALPAPAELPLAAGGAFVPSRTPVEELVGEIWADALGLPRVGVHDNFFALGGHSLIATRVVARLRQIGIELPVSALFDRPTVAELAEVVAEARGGTRPPAAPPLVRVAHGGPQPLSYAQLRFWRRRGEAGSASNTPFGVRLRGPLDAAALARSLAEIVRRHEILRTSFVEIDGEPAQVVHDQPGPTLPIADLSGLPASGHEAEVCRLGHLVGSAPFDIARELLIRTVLVRTAAAEHVLFLVKHHIATDGWSQAVLIDELAALYTAFRRGEPSPLPELQIQYADYAFWQRSFLCGPVLEELLAHWQMRLHGMKVLALPTDRPRPAVRSVRGGQRNRPLDAALRRRVRELGRRENASLFMTLLAAWKTLLFLWTGQEDIALTTNVANRSRGEIERSIGLFTNAIALRTDLSGDPTFRTVLGRVRETVLAAFAREDAPFVEILNRLCPERTASHNELFPVGFVVQNFPVRPLALPELTVEYLEVASGGAPRDLILLADDDAAEIWALYREDIFEAGTVDALLAGLTALLAQLVEDPARRLSTFPRFRVP